MSARMTPLQLRMLLDVFVSPDPIDLRILQNETQRAQFEAMIRDDLMEPRGIVGGGCFKVTARGRAFVESVLTMPYPEKSTVTVWHSRHAYRASTHTGPPIDIDEDSFYEDATEEAKEFEEHFGRKPGEPPH